MTTGKSIVMGKFSDMERKNAMYIQFGQKVHLRFVVQSF